MSFLHQQFNSLIEPTQGSSSATDQLQALKALFRDANQGDSKMLVLENAVLAMNIPHGIRHLVSVLQDEQASDAELQLATMCLIRHGEAAKEQIQRFALTPTTDRQIWIADFLMHQLGLDQPA